MANGDGGRNGAFSIEFERPLLQLESQIGDLESKAGSRAEDYAEDILNLRNAHMALLKKTYAKLSAYQTVQVARHPSRPQTTDYIRMFVKEFCELHGDRRFGDDKAIISGFGRIGPHKCMIIGHHKGRDTTEKIAANFGCAHPEGYRKALAKMKLAEKFGLPVVTLIDTGGAFPGIGAEERGIAEAIAVNLREMSRLRVPVVCCVIGEGGSGGALGLGVGDRIGMMQYAWYSVISPENCVAILWKTNSDAESTAVAAEQLSLTARDNLKNGVIDHIVPEPLGGAHRDPQQAADNLEGWITNTIREMKRYKTENLIERRHRKFRDIGAVTVG